MIPSVLDFWILVLLENTIGGVFLVELINYTQTGARHFLNSRYRVKNSAYANGCSGDTLATRTSRPVRNQRATDCPVISR